MAASLLRAYRKSNGDQPAKRVIIYRDGVSEGQFDEVVEKEVAALKAAFRQLDTKGPPPKLTYVVCGKRHHVRFYAKTPNDANRTGNLPAGTVVDRGVTSAVMSNFYLQAHASLVGTARPTHYSILVDENAFTADRLQQLTFKLCHAYARVTRSVSLVPPAYYTCVPVSPVKLAPILTPLSPPSGWPPGTSSAPLPARSSTTRICSSGRPRPRVTAAAARANRQRSRSGSSKTGSAMSPAFDSVM